MSEERLTYQQVAALLVLKTLGTEVARQDLEATWGLSLSTKNRAGLIDAKLMEMEKRERSLWYSITPAGEERALEEVQKGVVVTSRSGKTLALLYLRSLLEPTLPQVAAAPVVTSGRTDDEVEDRIREAYAKITPGVGEWVSLTKLRPLLSDIDRSEQDNALRRMLLNAPEVHILAAAIVGHLSPEDHAAAVMIGNEPNHQLRIGAR
ncbi:hypothetical protein GT755_15150 [Herbidospora sp. NEAU-GS84]|uniref:Uncharacterized protein n=1 Tax=Herbidospora solisilvae TaxID=2696284 RepID=A0A7C9JBZ8_9ACTN|nr:hypothetical protein [Herbidospora solisilvae]NAS23024.1 hypothetical protein [Herbidospora solisilvae]